MVGDLNVHSKAWLGHSSRNTPEGRLLAGTCNCNGLSQLAKQPTRGEYTLDFALSDLPALPIAQVPPKSIDHNAVLLKVDLPIPAVKPLTRTCWDYSKARWVELGQTLAATDWKSVLGSADVDVAVGSFNEWILECCKQLIPITQCSVSNCTVPWFSERCAKLVRDKYASEGTPSYEKYRDACSKGLKREFDKFIRNKKRHLSKSPDSSKKWWKLASMVSLKEGVSSSIPPLKD